MDRQNMDRQDEDRGQGPEQRDREMGMEPERLRSDMDTGMQPAMEPYEGRTERGMRGRTEEERRFSVPGALLAAGVGWMVWRALRGAGRSRASGRGRRQERGRTDWYGAEGYGAQSYGEQDYGTRDYGYENRGRARGRRRAGGRGARRAQGYGAYEDEGYGRRDRGGTYRRGEAGRRYGRDYGRSNYDYRYGSMNAGDLGYGGSTYGMTDVDALPGAYDYGDMYDYSAYDTDTYDDMYGLDTGDQDTGSNWSYTEMWWIPGPHTGRGPQGYQRAAEQIREDAHERLTQHGGIDAGDVTVRVDGSEITLEGTVDSRREKRMAEDAVDDIFGVTDVHNHLKVRADRKESGKGR